jgi:hypothetical protein
MVPFNSNIEINIPLIAGTPLSYSNHNIILIDKCDGSKNRINWAISSEAPIYGERSETIRKE